jgi:23S rRNA pseudouridine1911/1915/1917 synthase
MSLQRSSKNDAREAPLADDAEEEIEGTELIDVPLEAVGVRLDTFLGRRQNVHSRTYFQQLIKDGRVRVNGVQYPRSHELVGGEKIEIDFPPVESPWPQPQDIPIEILYHDEDVIVVNKAAGMIVHPAAGNPDGTLVNALLHHFPDLPGINGVKRPGLVHRLDRETSGVMVVAQNDRAMGILSRAIRERSVERVYLALIIGEPSWDETRIEAAIGRHESMRIKRSINGAGAKDAVTHVKVLARSLGFSLVRCRLETGRTHQIRVHLAHMGHSILGDELYGGTAQRAVERVRNASSLVRATVQKHGRPFLHARRLRFRHPADGQWRVFEAPLPTDLTTVLDVLFPAETIASALEQFSVGMD